MSKKEAAVAQALFMEVAEDRAVGVITANAVTDICYIARKSVGSEAATEAVKNLMTLFDIAAVEKAVKEVETRLREKFAELKPGVPVPAKVGDIIRALISKNGAFKF